MEVANYVVAIVPPLAIISYIARRAYNEGFPMVCGEDTVFIEPLYGYVEQYGLPAKATGYRAHWLKVIGSSLLSVMYMLLAIYGAIVVNTHFLVYGFTSMSFACCAWQLRADRFKSGKVDKGLRVYFLASLGVASVSFVVNPVPRTSMLMTCSVSVALAFHVALAVTYLLPRDVDDQIEFCVLMEESLNLNTHNTVNVAVEDGDITASLILQRSKTCSFDSTRHSRVFSDFETETSSSYRGSDDEDVAIVFPRKYNTDNTRRTSRSRESSISPRKKKHSSAWDEGMIAHHRSVSDAGSYHSLQGGRLRGGSADGSTYSSESMSSVGGEIYDSAEKELAQQAANSLMTALAKNPNMATNRRRWVFLSYPRCFRGHQVVDTLLESGDATTKEDGIRLGVLMIKYQLLEKITKRKHIFQGTDELVRLSPNVIGE